MVVQCGLNVSSTIATCTSAAWPGSSARGSALSSGTSTLPVHRFDAPFSTNRRLGHAYTSTIIPGSRSSPLQARSSRALVWHPRVTTVVVRSVATSGHPISGCPSRVLPWPLRGSTAVTPHSRQPAQHSRQPAHPCIGIRVAAGRATLCALLSCNGVGQVRAGQGLGRFGSLTFLSG